ncbi:hypothetical protein B0H66DRAFT_485286, partial [Apodospora peruviana]
QLPTIASYASSGPTIPYPKQQFPLQTARSQRPSLELITDFSESPKPANMARPTLGALGVTFAAMRALQFVAFITVVGVVASFINRINISDRDSPAELIGSLTVAAIGVVYVVVTFILYWDSILPPLVTTGLDSLLLIAAIVVASLLGQPLSRRNCETLPASSDLAFATNSTINSNSTISKTVTYLAFIATDKSTCYQAKAVWGLSIALAVAFAFSAMVCLGLWLRARKEAQANPPPGRAGANYREKVQPWESTRSIADDDMESPRNNPPRFPSPSLAPTTTRADNRRPPMEDGPDPILTPMPAPARSRGGLPPNPRMQIPRRFVDEFDDTAALVQDYKGPPKGRGLVPPPTRGRPPFNERGEGERGLGLPPMRRTRQMEPTLPPTPEGFDPEEDERDFAPGPVPTLAQPKPPQRRKELVPPPPPSPPRLFMPEMPPSPERGPEDEVIPDHHRRFPGLIPRSPLSPVRDFIARRGTRKQVPRLIDIKPGGRQVDAKRDVVRSPDEMMQDVSLQSPGLPTPNGQRTRQKRRTMWGVVEGWWELGLLERMGTIKKRKKMPTKLEGGDDM